MPIVSDDRATLIGVPRGALEDFARQCWKARTRVEAFGPVGRDPAGNITALNVETLKAVPEHV